MLEETDAPNFVAELELPEARATLGSPTAAWTADGQRALVERQVDARAWPWLDDQRADIGSVAVVLGIIVASWWIIRTLRCPRAAGRIYCRRCNQELDVSSGLPERCPECGSQLGRRQGVVGRTLAWRLLPLGLPALALAIAGALALRGTLVWSTAGTAIGGTVAWPVATLARIDGWPLWRVWRMVHVSTRVDVIDCSSSNELRHVSSCLIRHPAAGAWVASDDGRTLAWTVFDASNDWAQEVRWFESDTQTMRSAVVGSNADGFIRVCGFTPDGRSIVARRDRLVDTPPASGAAGPPTAPHAVEIITVDTASGNVRVVAESEARAIGQPPPGTNFLFEDGTAAVGAGPHFQWATVTLSLPQRPTQAARARQLTNLMVGTAGGMRRVELKEHQLILLRQIGRARIEDDRRLVFEGPGPWIGMVLGVEVDLDTGVVSLSDRLGETVSPQGTSISSRIASPDGRRAVEIATTTAKTTTPIGTPEIESVRLQLWRR